jgi:protein-disulfide isomerase
MRQNGFRAIGGLTQRLASGLAPKGKGRTRAVAPLVRLKAQWPAIVGPEIARVSEPDALLAGRGAKSAGAALRLRVAGAAALELQHRSAQIVERVNGHFGHRLIDDIRLVRGVISAKAGPIKPPTPDRTTMEQIERRVADVKDPDLKAALARLGGRISASTSSGRRVLILGAFGVLAAPRIVRAQPAPPSPPSPGDQAPLLALRADDHVLGKQDAPITVIDYFSLTCPHCANFAVAILPQLRLRFIDTGKVKFVYRHFPSDVIATHAALLAECAGRPKYFEAIDALFRNQLDWLTQTDAEGDMTKVLQAKGMAVDAKCFENDQLLDRVVEDVESGRRLKVNFTPTLFINGKNVGNPGGLDDIAKILADIGR